MSLPAHEWIAASSVDPAIFDRWPGYRVVLLAADAVDVTGLAPTADRLIDEAVTRARRLDPTTTDAHVATWQQAYRDFGVKPRIGRVSVDALTRRAVSDAGLPRINTLVDIYNAISVINQVPIGGEDLDRYHGPARLHLAQGHEPFLTNADGSPVIDHPEAGEPVWVDDKGVTCRRWNWRQTTRTAIRPDTTRVGFIIDSLDVPDHTRSEQAAQHLAENRLNGRHRRAVYPHVVGGDSFDSEPVPIEGDDRHGDRGVHAPDAGAALPNGRVGEVVPGASDLHFGLRIEALAT